MTALFTLSRTLFLTENRLFIEEKCKIEIMKIEKLSFYPTAIIGYTLTLCQCSLITLVYVFLDVLKPRSCIDADDITMALPGF